MRFGSRFLLPRLTTGTHALTLLAFGSTRASVKELNSAVAAMEQLSAGDAFQEIEEPGMHLVDLVGVLQLAQPIGAAHGAAREFTEMILEKPGDVLFGVAAFA